MKWFASGLVILIALSASAQDTDHDAVKAHLKAQNQKIIAALKSSNAQAYADLFVSDGFLMVPGAPVTEGKVSIFRERARTFNQVRVLDGDIITQDLKVRGDTAYERGVFRYTLHAGDGGNRVITGKYLTIWVKTEDGSWLIQGDIGLPD